MTLTNPTTILAVHTLVWINLSCTHIGLHETLGVHTLACMQP